MIHFHFQKAYALKNRNFLKNWISGSVQLMNKELGNINYIFCDNDYIKSINEKYLQHDDTTDIITFDYTSLNTLHADIYISIDEVRLNKAHFKTSMKNELHRVMIHGILHLVGYKDETDRQKTEMRKLEDYHLSLRTF